MKNYNKLNIKLALILISLAYKFPITSSQRKEAIEVLKCAKYKMDVYEKEITYGGFVYGSPDLVYHKDDCKSLEPFISGGEMAKPKEFPFAARVGRQAMADNEQEEVKQAKIKWFCGGTLLSEKFVLTAAHCFYSDYGEVNRVRLGELDFSNSKDDAEPEDFEIKNTFDHPKYDDALPYHDIGLIELKKSVKFNRYKHPACLPIDSSATIDKFLAVGWGRQGYFELESDHLLKVSLDRFTYDRCNMISIENEHFKKGIDNETQICAGSFDSTKDTCPGDSGGPLLTYHKDYPCMYNVAGVTAAGLGACGFQNVPGVYTNVYYYLEWIKEHVWP